ncbi:MAG: hypothetical protein PUC00_04030 [Clostridiales bacterium]|nr:hypothetical protein [Clostridiales bacterium]
MKRSRSGIVRGLAVTLAVFAVLLVFAFVLISRIDQGAGDEQTALICDAVKNALVTCYAVEGSYPPDVEYLKAHYGLAYDAERYIVTFDAFASNVMPDVRVRVRGEAGL